MRMNAPRGQKVSPIPSRLDHRGGNDPTPLLTASVTYTVEETIVFRSSSYVRLAEHPGEEFCTTLFEEVGVLLPSVDTVEAIYLRGLMERQGPMYEPYGPDEDEEIQQP